MHCLIKTYRQKAWDDGVTPSAQAPEVGYNLLWHKKYTCLITRYRSEDSRHSFYSEMVLSYINTAEIEGLMHSTHGSKANNPKMNYKIHTYTDKCRHSWQHHNYMLSSSYIKQRSNHLTQFIMQWIWWFVFMKTRWTLLSQLDVQKVVAHCLSLYLFCIHHTYICFITRIKAQWILRKFEAI